MGERLSEVHPSRYTPVRSKKRNGLLHCFEESNGTVLQLRSLKVSERHMGPWLCAQGKSENKSLTSDQSFSGIGCGWGDNYRQKVS